MQTEIAVYRYSLKSWFEEFSKILFDIIMKGNLTQAYFLRILQNYRKAFDRIFTTDCLFFLNGGATSYFKKQESF